ncbi:MAG: helix-turn-helix domain-containing protein [Candidatus Magasanikbacteria bacterium]|nr:helix-turn-helix domain-containing protein [Candidatus Magasanikbacteria bacterium]
MVSFTSKKLNKKKSAADFLKEARQKKGASISTMAKNLAISPKFVEALEEGRFQSLPGEIYTKNFIKRYARCLGCDSALLLKKYAEEKKQGEKSVIHFTPICRLTNLSGILRRLAGALTMAGLLIYLSLEVGGIFKTPLLIVESPEEGLTVEESSLIVKGKTLPETSVLINGTETLSNQDGLFSETINLVAGANTILVTANKKHGRSASLLRHVVLKEKNENGGVSLLNKGY